MRSWGARRVGGGCEEDGGCFGLGVCGCGDGVLGGEVEREKAAVEGRVGDCYV